MQFLQRHTKFASPRLPDMSRVSFCWKVNGVGTTGSGVGGKTHKPADANHVVVHFATRRARHLKHVVEGLALGIFGEQVRDAALSAGACQGGWGG